MVEITFFDELVSILNIYGIDNDCDTPDYILADHIVRQLEAYKTTVMTRDKWAGRQSIGEQIVGAAIDDPIRGRVIGDD